ncbi:MAG: hypothetical protein M3525_00840 [Acidobacteriota bacterium]|nr:hypothetical protein [Acidobacteriota bacterium]
MRLLTIVNFLFLILIGFANNAECQNSSKLPLQQPTLKQPQEVIEFADRFKKPEHINLLHGALWTVTHDYADFKHMQEVLSVFQSYIEAVGKYEHGDFSTLEKLGGIKAFKEKSVEWLKDDDQAIRAFSAVLLGIIGDKTYAPQLASLLKLKIYKKDPLSVYDRGRAAMALGLIEAKEYMPEILPLLKSENQYDRQGAISALGYFNAKEYSKEIAGILTNKDLQFDDDSSPIFFLVEMETAKDYKKELIQVMLGEFRSETREAAMYALVNLKAKEAAPEIAKLLKDKFKKGDAAKALALLDAKEYANEIAHLLKDESGLVRQDAALALGILKAKRYADEVAKLLNDKESYVHTNAATALLLMEAKEYYKIALPIVERPLSEIRYLIENQFHPLVTEKVQQITEDLKKSFEKAKTFSANQK